MIRINPANLYKFAGFCIFMVNSIARYIAVIHYYFRDCLLVTLMAQLEATGSNFAVSSYQEFMGGEYQFLYYFR